MALKQIIFFACVVVLARCLPDDDSDEDHRGYHYNPPSSAASVEEPGMPFDFAWQVNDDEGNDFAHAANSDGEVVQGEYRVDLPDGRTQIVTYRADPVNGYTAEVTYEGEAHFPEVDSSYEAPVEAPRRNYLTPSK